MKRRSAGTDVSSSEAVEEEVVAAAAEVVAPRVGQPKR